MKNGLFLLSIGFLIFLFSVDRQTANYDLFQMVTGLTFILSGAALVYKNKNQEQS